SRCFGPRSSLAVFSGGNSVVRGIFSRCEFFRVSRDDDHVHLSQDSTLLVNQGDELAHRAGTKPATAGGRASWCNACRTGSSGWVHPWSYTGPTDHTVQIICTSHGIRGLQTLSGSFDRLFSKRVVGGRLCSWSFFSGAASSVSRFIAWRLT
ncbi:unnamed protein product, partial [Hapterophycus canaliculatus]